MLSGSLTASSEIIFCASEINANANAIRICSYRESAQNILKGRKWSKRSRKCATQCCFGIS